VELTVNYRTPAEIMDLADRVLEKVAPGISPATSIRSTGTPPQVLTVARSENSVPLESLTALAAQSVRDELERFAAEGGAGTVALITPPSLARPVGAALSASGVEYGSAGHGALEHTVTLLTIEDAKGLEFDFVAVVEPARIVQETAQGLRSLYVALTRATQRLVVVHSEALPAPLAGASQHLGVSLEG
jgi:DNA helicase IV